MNKHKFLAFVLCIFSILALCSCEKKECDCGCDYCCGGKLAETNAPESIEPEKNDSEEEITFSVLEGTWVVEENEIFDGPMKSTAKNLAETYYPIGREFIFKDDGTFQSSDGKLSTKYEKISDKQLSVVAMNTGETMVHDYELNGDELIIYGNYNGDYAHYGHSVATHFKRK